MPIFPAYLPDSDQLNHEVLQRAAEALRDGELVAFPTETVYGLGANALDAAAVKQIFEAKGRPAFNPLIVHIPAIDAARELVTEWPERADLLARHFWPGALTLILPKREVVPGIVTAGLDSVGVRVPAHPVALALLRQAGIPLAAPSANRYTETSPTTAVHVEKSLGERAPLILDGGPCEVGIESTVLDLSGQRPTLLRPGMVSVEAIEQVLGEVVIVGNVSGDEETPKRSPGMVRRHYAPKARLVVFRTAEELDALLRERQGQAIGVLVHRIPLPNLSVHRAAQLPDEPTGYASQLYGELHAFDESGCNLVLIEEVPHDVAWLGVRDRIQRATTPA